MSDDQSFYEIQLNTPHLVLAFLGAAVIGVAIFWVGVVIGRGQSESAAPQGFQAAAPGGQATSPEAGEIEDPLDAYDPATEPASPAAAAEDAVADGGSAPAQGSVDENTSQAESDSATETGQFQPADPVDEPRDPVVADSAASGRPQHDESLASGWVVQVRSTPDRESADSLQAALAVDGFPAFVVSADVNGETYYRVRVGRYASRGDAETIEAELVTRADIESAWVTEG